MITIKTEDIKVIKMRQFLGDIPTFRIRIEWWQSGYTNVIGHATSVNNFLENTIGRIGELIFDNITTIKI